MKSLLDIEEAIVKRAFKYARRVGVALYPVVRTAYSNRDPMQYMGEVTMDKRYVALAFDDFRNTDFTWVLPMLKEYGVKATFSFINPGYPSPRLKHRIRILQKAGCEVGDHTILHHTWMFCSPLFNGYNPTDLDGSNQIPYPTNDELRRDRGDGKNVFGKDLKDEVQFDGFGVDIHGTSWGQLTEAQCQEIRDYYSIMGRQDVCRILDDLSHEWLGTKGYSKGSWSEEKRCYTRGIFTGCSNSENHAVWERMMEIQRLYFQKYCGSKQPLMTWSMPGGEFDMLYYEKGRKYFFDRGYSKLANMRAEFMSANNLLWGGKIQIRSIIGIFRQFGILVVQDGMHQGLLDGEAVNEGARVNILNSSYSKENAYGSRVERIIAPWGGNTNVRKTINAIRHATGQGRVATSSWDSTESEGEKVLLRSILEYCRATGTELVTDAEMYDICYEHTVIKGNLLTNALLRNTMSEWLGDACEDACPDGFEGDCRVDVSDGDRWLVVSGEAYCRQYGVPTGELIFRAQVGGEGYIRIYAIHNNTEMNDIGEKLAEVRIESSGEVTLPLSIRKLSNDEAICGIAICYEGELKISKLELIDRKRCGIT